MRRHHPIRGRRVWILFCVPLAAGLLSQWPAFGQLPDAEVLRAGYNFIETPVYTAEEDQAVLEMFRGLRVADVADGLDRVGLKNSTLVDPAIHPLWKDTETFAHRFIGIAVTVRYVATNEPDRTASESHEEFDQFLSDWYRDLSSEPFQPLLRPGTALVIDEAEGVDVGSIGSNNILGWVRSGCVGVVTSGTARDTDEIIAQQVPLYFREPGRGVRPGRNEVESVNRPVEIGGVQVRPGDVIVADGDGVLVVPREQAETVAGYARATLDSDREGRRQHYEALGLPLDPSVLREGEQPDSEAAPEPEAASDDEPE